MSITKTLKQKKTQQLDTLACESGRCYSKRERNPVALARGACHSVTFARELEYSGGIEFINASDI